MGAKIQFVMKSRPVNAILLPLRGIKNLKLENY